MLVRNNLPSLTPRAIVRETSFTAGFLSHSASLPALRKPRYSPAPVPRKPVSAIVSLPAEPEDAYITGATRSLSRRLLALNMRQAS